MQFFCYSDAWLGKCLSKSQYLQFYSGLAVNKNAGPNTSFFEKIRVICFIIASYLSLICLIMASYMRHSWIWWRILDTGLLIGKRFIKCEYAGRGKLNTQHLLCSSGRVRISGRVALYQLASHTVTASEHRGSVFQKLCKPRTISVYVNTMYTCIFVELSH